jgi:hypothetical protein
VGVAHLIALSIRVVSGTHDAFGGDPVHRYTDVANPIAYRALHLARKTAKLRDGRTIHLNSWDSGETTEIVFSGNGRFGRKTSPAVLARDASYQEIFF